MVAVASVLISAGKTQARHQKPVDRSDRRADREAGENRDRQRLVAAARDSRAENKAQRQDRADGKVDPAHQHDERLAYRNQEPAARPAGREEASAPEAGTRG